jgi:hypothetical protein
MTDHVNRKYPDRVGAIQALRKKDLSFEEMCNDYEEMCSWMAVLGCSTDPHSEECVHAKEIIRDLEDEIERTLQEAGL